MMLEHGEALNRTAPPQCRPDSALFLDFDGTLVEIAAAPSDVNIPANLIPMLRRLTIGFGGAVAIISGRTISDVDRFLDKSIAAVAGVHGIERRTATGRSNEQSGFVSAEIEDAIFAAKKLKQRWPRIVVEEKGPAVALHYRQEPGAKEDCIALLQSIAYQTNADLEVIRGKCVVELKEGTANKGAAVMAFMNESPFKSRIPVYIGDDETDETAFKVVSAMGGLSIAVGTKRSVHAPYHFASVNEVHHWLAAAVTGK